MSEDFLDYLKSSAVIRNKLGKFKPQILLVLGSGLGYMADEVEDPIIVPYKDCPGFKISTAPGHKGQFVFGKLCGKNVACMQGRMHFYEGYTMKEIIYPIRVAQLLGVSKMIVTNAAGAINTEFHPGEIMLITDHIKFGTTGPLVGPNIPEIGTRFPDMTHVYNPELCEKARIAAKKCGIGLREGTYIYFAGPQFETPAEIRAARVLGADASGMSTVPEATAAVHAGMKVVGFSLLSNMAAGIIDKPLSGEDVNECAAQSAPRFKKLIETLLEDI